MNEHVAIADASPGERVGSTDQSSHRASRCVTLLRDDYERQSGYLHVDDVHRIISRLGLSVDEAMVVWEDLASAEIPVDGLVTEEGGEEDDAQGKAGNTTSPPDFAGDADHWFESYAFHELLTHEEEIQLARRVHAGLAVLETDSRFPPTDESARIAAVASKARARLIVCNLRLVIYSAKKFARKSDIWLEDLVQEGILGLFRAVEKYDPERGYRFATYASWWINQSIRRAIDVTRRMIRLPSHTLDQLRRLQRKRRRLGNQLRRKPWAKELAAELGWDVEQVNLLLQVEQDVRSLDQGRDPTETSERRYGLRSRAVSPSEAAERVELAHVIDQVLSTLDERAQSIVVLRFGLNGSKPHTLEQVGKRFGVTRERIRQIEKRALEKMSMGSRGAILRKCAGMDEEWELTESNE